LCLLVSKVVISKVIISIVSVILCGHYLVPVYTFDNDKISTLTITRNDVKMFQVFNKQTFALNHNTVDQIFGIFILKINSFCCSHSDLDQIAKIFQVLGTPTEEIWFKVHKHFTCNTYSCSKLS
jgi:hypothetical protein